MSIMRFSHIWKTQKLALAIVTNWLEPLKGTMRHQETLQQLNPFITTKYLKQKAVENFKTLER